MENDLKKLFVFCENNIEDFNSKKCDESVHYYINDKLIGGYAGDRDVFFLRKCKESSALMAEFKAHEVTIGCRGGVENRVDLKVITQNRGLGLEIKRVDSNISLGFQDGPEDRVYDVVGVNNLVELVSELEAMSHVYEGFPKDPVFYIDNKKFTTIKDSEIAMYDKFPIDLIKKYNTKEIKTLNLIKNDDNTFSVEEGFYPFLYESPNNTLRKEPIKFETTESALAAIKEKLMGENVILNNKPFGDNLPKIENKRKISGNRI